MITLRGSDKSWDYASGTSLALWPKGGKVLLAKAPFTDSTATVLFDGHEPKADNVPVLGLLQVPTPLDYGSRLSAPGKEDSVRPGRLIVYGDSNCVDSAHMTQPCWWLFEQLISYAVTGVVNVELDVGLDLLHAQLHRRRRRVGRGGAALAKPLPLPRPHVRPPAAPRRSGRHGW